MTKLSIVIPTYNEKENLPILAGAIDSCLSDSDYELVIYNVNGQKVNSFQGAAEAGMVELEVDFSTVASGVYFYRLSAGDFSDVKKMVLLK